MSSCPVSSLRVHLLESLSTLPGSRVFHIHVLATTPRKPGKSLFLYARTRPKCLVQDILVLLSEQTDTEHESTSGISPTVQPSTKFTRKFVTAIEASVFAFPASDSTILYVSKVDGTGQGLYPSPTSTLVRAFLLFYTSRQSPSYLSPTTIHHLWIHLFARSQRQYLFPNSADHPRKKPLGDVALCKWWKKVLSDVAEDVRRTDNSGVTASEPLEQSIRLYFLLPGQTELEASYLLREAQPSSTHKNTQWIYSHPYVDAGLIFPSGATSALAPAEDYTPLASLIPYFEDDPKSRFLDELAATSEEHPVAVPVPTPKRKRQKVAAEGGEGGQDSNSTVAIGERHENAVAGPCSTEMSQNAFRIAEAHDTELHSAPIIMYNPPSSPAPAETLSPPLRHSTPGPKESQQTTLLSPHTPSFPTFPTAPLSPHTPINRHNTSKSQPSTPDAIFKTSQTPRTPRHPKTDLDTITPAEFWERMSFRQECAVGAVTGFFVAVFSRRSDKVMLSKQSNAPHVSSTLLQRDDSTDIPCTLLNEGTIPSPVLKRVMSTLLTGVEFSTDEWTHKGTHVIESAIKGLCGGLGKDKTSGDETDIYAPHVYATLSVTKPPLACKSTIESTDPAPITATLVNILGVRKKKKRQE